MMQKFIYTGPSGFYTEGTVTDTVTTCVCDSTLPTNVLVMASSTVASGVDVVTDNTDVRYIIGYVVDKPTDTTASVLTKGVITGLSGLTKGEKVYLGTNGSFTNVKPNSGYLHVLGKAIDTDKLDFDPAPTKLKLVYVPQLNLPLSLEQTVLAPSSGSYFGWRADYDGNKAVVTEYSGSLSAYIYKFDGTSFTLEQTLPSANQATCAINSNIVLIGEPYYDGTNADEGRVQIYTFDGASWSLTQTLSSPTPSASGNFGIDLYIHNNKVVIGERGKGYVHLYNIINNNVSLDVSLTLPTTAATIGASVALTDTFLAAGYSDSVWLFNYDGSSWNTLQTITDPLNSSDFGQSLSLYETKLLVGEPGNDKAYIYSFDGSAFVLEQDLSILTPITSGAKYGYSVYLYKDVAIVGAYYESSRDGAVYLYKFDGSSWLFSQKLETSGTIDNFGLDVVAGGSELLVTADAYNGTDGSVYLYK